MQAEGEEMLLISQKARRGFAHSRRGIGIAVVVGIMLASPARAQDDAGVRLWFEGGCAGCHGALAAGGDGLPGPNLRLANLDRDQLLETIACGRPGTEMPYNFVGAYTMAGAYVIEACYGLPIGGDAPVARGADYLVDELNTLVDFLTEYVVGVAISRENCAVFFGGDKDSPACAGFD